MAEKLINRNDILYDLINNIAPRYFDMDSIDQNRTSYFGYLSEADAKAIEDTITLEQRRAVDYCPELSNSGIRVRQTAKIRGVEVSRARPGQVFAVIQVLKSDILSKGEQISSVETQFIIDRRSTITYDGIPFSLPDDIIIRAFKKISGYIYTVGYSGQYQSFDNDYLQVYESGPGERGEEFIMMTVVLYQYNYNIQEKIVTDAVAFLYDGIEFDYENKLAGFEVYYRKTATSDYTRLELDHYLTTETTNSILYNDDDEGILFILNNPNLNIPVNSMIRVDIQETLAEDGEITLSDTPTYFSLYRDDKYNYAGVSINCAILTDVINSDNGDDLGDIKKKLIDAKTRRDNITTEHDIISYINDIDSNIQIVKKRNDIEDRRLYLYTLLRYVKDIVPTTTRNLELSGPTSIFPKGDFDYIVGPPIDRKVIAAQSKFSLMSRINDDGEYEEYITKVSISSMEEYDFISPFMLIIDKDNLVHYYLTTINESIMLSKYPLGSEEAFPFEMVTHNILITRDSHTNKYDNDLDISKYASRYYFTLVMTRNTSSDEDLIEVLEDGTVHVVDETCIVPYVVFRINNTPNSYLKMEFDNYNSETREFTFKGIIRTNDFITEENKLNIIEGLCNVRTGTVFDSVIDYENAFFDIYVMYKYDDSEHEYDRSNIIYSLLPEGLTNEYVLSTHYYNNTLNPYNLIYEYSKFTSSFNEMRAITDTEYKYIIHEVPFIEYDFGRKNMVNMYSTFEYMLTLYGELLKLTTDFDISLKFIATYGRSRYIWVEGQHIDSETGKLVPHTINLADLNPVLKFKVHGIDINVAEVAEYIRVYMRDHYITGEKVFISNICTAVEDNFSRVKSITYQGIETESANYNSSYQEFYYEPPEFNSKDVITKYIPEQFNITKVKVDLEED